MVSMVPSWTETLLWADVEVVGRTRFCLHPTQRVAGIPKVGGTKDWNEAKVRAVRPDLLVLDREENPHWMAEQEGLPFWASHVTGLESLPGALGDLSATLSNPALARLGERWRRVCDCPSRDLTLLGEDWPGVLEWGRQPTRPVTSVVYVIWRNPWMAVGPTTFIGSVLGKLGLPVRPNLERYPTVELESLPSDTLLLFSSEPFPFLRKREGLEELGLPYAFVDGESFSWFGIRSLTFLEQALGIAGSPSEGHPL